MPSQRLGRRLLVVEVALVDPLERLIAGFPRLGVNRRLPLPRLLDQRDWNIGQMDNLRGDRA
jgi:hypothetical protein